MLLVSHVLPRGLIDRFVHPEIVPRAVAATSPLLGLLTSTDCRRSVGESLQCAQFTAMTAAGRLCQLWARGSHSL